MLLVGYRDFQKETAPFGICLFGVGLVIAISIARPEIVLQFDGADTELVWCDALPIRG